MKKVPTWTGLKWSLTIVSLLILFICPHCSCAEDDLDHVPGVTYKLVDQFGTVVSLTSRKPARGDEIINAQGYHYKVVGTQGKKARVSLVGKDKHFLTLVDYYSGLDAAPVTTQKWHLRPVGIYHTHSDESYIPTDGVASIPFRGGIYQVGNSFQRELKQNKVRVEYDETPHDPHDANAYYRSRRTAINLLKKNPVALFDVHRDGIDDPEFYGQIIPRENATQIRLVVGRQNPKMASNLDFAKRLMAFANKRHPDLVKEIYMAKGNYNQDLLSTALLIEAGTYTNHKPQAESGVDLLAQCVPGLMGLTAPPAPGQKGITSSEAGVLGWKTTLFILFLLLLGGAGFVYINYPENKVWKHWLDRVEKLIRERYLK